MRKSFVVALIVASLGLASCGVQASLTSAVDSLGSSPDLQVHVTASVSGAGTAQAQRVLSDVSLDVSFANPTGAALSQANGNANGEVVLNANNQAVVDLRVVASNAYVMVNLTALSSLPGVNVPTSEVAELDLLLGGRWFEFPNSLLSDLPSQPTLKANGAKEKVGERKIIDALSGVIAATKYTTLPGGGFSQTGTLASIVQALAPTLQSLASSAISVPTSVPGTYSLTVTTSGSTATGGSVSISAPQGTLNLNATVTHASDAVVAPTGATIITPDVLKGLLSDASSSNLTLQGVQSGTLNPA